MGEAVVMSLQQQREVGASELACLPAVGVSPYTHPSSRALSPLTLS